MSLFTLKTEAEKIYEPFLKEISENSGRYLAAQNFLTHGFPHRHLEKWRWTDLRAHLRTPFPYVFEQKNPFETWDQLKAKFLSDLPIGKRAVWVNGCYNPLLSDLPSGVSLRVLDPDLPCERAVQDSVSSLAQALSSGRAHLSFSEQYTAEDWLALIFISSCPTAKTFATDVRLDISSQANLKIFEVHRGEGAYVTLPRFEYHLQDGARLERVKLAEDSQQSYPLAFLEATFGKNVTWRDYVLTLGGGVSHSRSVFSFLGEESTLFFSGAAFLKENQHAETALEVNHRVPACTSRELFKCVLDDRARGAFQAKVMVAPHAQKTDGKQSSHGLLLGEFAEFDTKPELEIFADDVACGHGATVGRLDPEQVFYMLSRGIPARQAEALLIEAFLQDAFEEVSSGEIKYILCNKILEKLEKRGGIHGL